MIQKQTVSINFAQALNTKADPRQVPVGQFVQLQNTIFQKAGELQKRNGFAQISPLLPAGDFQRLTTFDGALTAIGSSIVTLSEGVGQWINNGTITPTQLSVKSILRNNTGQIQCDSVVSANNLVCTVYMDNNSGSPVAKYVVTDYVNSQVVIKPTVITPSVGTVINSPRVYFLGSYFIIIFGTDQSSVKHLHYIAINTATLQARPSVSLTSQYSPAATLPFDAVVSNGILYLAWNSSDSGGSIRMNLLNSSLVQLESSIVGPGTVNTHASVISLAVDANSSTGAVWVFYAGADGAYAFAISFSQFVATVLSAVQIATNSPVIGNVACAVASTGTLTTYWEVINNYGYDATIPTNYIKTRTITQSGTLGTASVLRRSVGLASKAFVSGGIPFFLSVYASVYQSTYFLTNGATGGECAKFAWQIAEGSITASSACLGTGLPNAQLQPDGQTVNIAYLIKDLIQSVNSPQVAATSGINATGILSQVAAKQNIYTQAGINLATIVISNQNIITAEIGNNLLISGGLTTMFDGTVVTEQNFNLYPDYVELAGSVTGGIMLCNQNQQYFYQAVYQWTDSQGNIFNSAPSIPFPSNGLTLPSTNPQTFTAFFTSGQSTIYVGATTGLSVGQIITDTTTGGNIQGNTMITAINGNAVSISNPTLGASAKTDTADTTGTGASGQKVIAVASATGITLGMLVTDADNAGSIAANSVVTAISGTNITISINIVTTLSSDNLKFWAVDAMATAMTGSVTVNVPTARLTYKTANPIKVILFRWSTQQPVWAQVTSITAPLLNDPTVDYVTFVDTQSDQQISGNSQIYTMGGIVEDVAPPSFTTMTLFDSRCWGVSAENPNVLWFSKQVIDGTPVEFSDLLTFFVAPTAAAQTSTGPVTAMAPMDDKLILFKGSSSYYINGSGPDNTGANNQYSEPIFITSTVGSINQNSLVFTDKGLQFQSSQGIWQIGRQIGTDYAGAMVEGLVNGEKVIGALNIPGTTQIRFDLDSGGSVMYDYYFGLWGNFVGYTSVSSCLYQGLHSFLSTDGSVYQESPGTYLDGADPVLMSFITGPIHVAGLQGYQRLYEIFPLGTFLSPCRLVFQIGYNLPTTTKLQQSIINPTNYAGPFGSDLVFGQTEFYGGPGNTIDWRIHSQNQQCRNFYVSFQEQFDNSFSLEQAGAGLTLSGLNCVVAVKKGWTPISASHSVG